MCFIWCQAGVHQLVHSGSGKVGITSSKDLLPLPKGLWSEKSQPEKDLYSLSVGWLVDGNNIVSSNFEFSATGEPKVSIRKHCFAGIASYVYIHM